MSNKPSAPFPALLGLRAVVATLVFIYHYYGTEEKPLTLLNWLNSLNFRMTIFFVLSGFGIMMSLLPRQRLTAAELYNYFYKRFLRLFPLYLFLLVVPYLQVGLPEWPVLLTNLTLSKGYFQRLMLSGIAPAWSLSVEVSFYIAAPFLLWGLSSVYKFGFTLLVIILLGLSLVLTGYWLNLGGLNPYGFLIEPAFIREYTFIGRFTDFLAGVFLAWVLFHQPNTTISLPFSFFHHTYLALLLVCGVSFLEYYFSVSALGAGPAMAILLFHVILPLSVSYFIYGLVQEKTLLSRILSTKFMLMLGSSSYGFYLMHLSWMQYKISKINPLPDQGFVLLWITALLTFYFFEKPVILYFRRKFLVSKAFPANEAKG